MIEEAWSRALKIADPGSIWVLTKARYRSQCIEALGSTIADRLVFDPEDVTLATAIGSAVDSLGLVGSPATAVVCLPTDQVCSEVDLLVEPLRTLLRTLNEGEVGLLGQQLPAFSDQLGYIGLESPGCGIVRAFVEKPVSVDVLDPSLVWYANVGVLVLTVAGLEELLRECSGKVEYLIERRPQIARVELLDHPILDLGTWQAVEQFLGARHESPGDDVVDV